MSEVLAQGLRDTAKWIRSKDPLATNYLFCLQAAETLSAPPVPQPDREAWARIIDPAAFPVAGCTILSDELGRLADKMGIGSPASRALAKADAIIATLSPLSQTQEEKP